MSSSIVAGIVCGPYLSAIVYLSGLTINLVYGVDISDISIGFPSTSRRSDGEVGPRIVLQGARTDTGFGAGTGLLSHRGHDFYPSPWSPDPDPFSPWPGPAPGWPSWGESPKNREDVVL